MDKLSLLARINVMDELPDEVLEEIGRSAPMVTAARGRVFVDPSEPRQVLYLLKQGKVRLYRISPEGKQFTVALLGDGNIFGETGTFSTGTHDAYAEALEDSIICVLHRDDAQRLLERYPRLALRLLEVVSGRLREAEELMSHMAMGDARSRVLYLLHKLSLSFGAQPEDGWVRITIPLTHQEIANMVGATRETVSVTLSGLERDELVRGGRREIWVHPGRVSEQLNSGT